MTLFFGISSNWGNGDFTVLKYASKHVPVNDKLAVKSLKGELFCSEYRVE